MLDTLSDIFGNSYTLSALVLLGLVWIFFVGSAYNAYRKAGKRIGHLSDLLTNETSVSIYEKRQELIEKAKQLQQGNKHLRNTGHLWLEFDQTLIEVALADNKNLHNTLDASYFFNTSTLAHDLTENRLLAAGTGILTALGVTGTFLGLVFGLSELNIGSDIAVEEMKEGLASVISGASFAFTSSLFGILFSVVFNFIEKSLEGSVRKKILSLQNKIDTLFPRMSAEQQLQNIARDGAQSRQTLQCLAEEIGHKMQESMIASSKSIQDALVSSLQDIMAPAINKLVDGASESSQVAIESHVEKFLEKFGELGSLQREGMDQAAASINDALGNMHTAMADFIGGLEESQGAAGRREQELVSTISSQVSQLVTQAGEQKRTMTAFIENQLDSLSNQFAEREENAARLDQERNQVLLDQTNAMKSGTDTLLQRIDENLATQRVTSEQIIEQGKVLQRGMESSVQANAEAATGMQAAATELHSVAESMDRTSQQIDSAGTQLSEAIGSAVASTKELADQNQQTSEYMEGLRKQLLSDVARFSDVTEKLQYLVDSADTVFSAMEDHQQQYLDALKVNVEDLAKNMRDSLEDYAKQANSQTQDHLSVWSGHTTNYAESMKNITNALNDIVEEIQEKLE